MASTNAQRQSDRHKRMLEKGFKKRAFYLDEDTLKRLEAYKTEIRVQSLDEAINELIKRTLS